MTSPVSPLASQHQTRTIGDCVYRVEPLGFRSGRPAFTRFLNLIGPAIAKFSSLGDVTKDAPSDESNPRAQAAFMAALGQLLMTISDSDLQYFEDLFAARTWVRLPNGNEPLLSDAIKALPCHFDGPRFGSYYVWLAFAIEVSFGAFFGDAWRTIAASSKAGEKRGNSSNSVSPTE